MSIYLISFAAFCSTLLGGAFALRFKDKLHLILGFSAGAVIGVAFFDLLPEAINLATPIFSIPTVTSVVAFGFVIYMILDRSIFFHSHTHGEEGGASSQGKLGAGSLTLHSFLDGVAIGLAFKVSTAVGIVVAIAVLVHDFSDGINTVGLIVKSGGERKEAFRWLLLDAVAPVLGIMSTMFFTLQTSSLGILLAFFAGFFLYIGASDLLPESHHGHPTYWTTIITILGMGVLFVAIQVAHL